MRSHRRSLPAVLAAATVVAAAGTLLAVLVRPDGWDEAAHTDPLALRILGGPVPPALLVVAGVALAALVVALVVAARDESAPAVDRPAPG